MKKKRKEKLIEELIREIKHDDGCLAFSPKGTLKKLFGMEPNKCTCRKALILKAIEEL